MFKSCFVSSAMLLVSAGLMCPTEANAQNRSVTAEQTVDGKRATQLADQVYVESANLALLQLYYSPRDAEREAAVQGKIDAAMRSFSSLEAASAANAKPGEMTQLVAAFMVQERASAELVIANLIGIEKYGSSPADSPLLGNPELDFLTKFYGRLPGTPNTPQFYLGLLTWARYGFPKPLLKLDVRLPPATTGEARRRKLEQIENPGHYEGYTPAPVPSFAETFLQNNRSKYVISQRGLGSAVQSTR